MQVVVPSFSNLGMYCRRSHVCFCLACVKRTERLIVVMSWRVPCCFPHMFVSHNSVIITKPTPATSDNHACGSIIVLVTGHAVPMFSRFIMLRRTLDGPSLILEEFQRVPGYVYVHDKPRQKQKPVINKSGVRCSKLIASLAVSTLERNMRPVCCSNTQTVMLMTVPGECLCGVVGRKRLASSFNGVQRLA